MVILDKDSLIISDYEHYEWVVEKMMLKAKKSLLISTADVKNLFISEYSSSLLDLFNQNGEVKVKILHGSNPTMSFKEKFKELNPKKWLKLKYCNRIHMKYVISDDAVAYLGSANFTGAGLGAKSPVNRNFESGLITVNPTIIKYMKQRFMAIWNEKYCADCGEKRKKYCVEYKWD